MPWRLGLFALLCAIALGCGGPVRQAGGPSGELIAFGGGPGGALDACFTCHGLNGEGLADAPRLAGLDAGYLMKQLFDYAHARRADETMEPIARRLNHRAMLAVSDYYADMPAPSPPAFAPPALYARGDPGRGLLACADCHGPEALGRGSHYPALAGQPAAYTEEQLIRWRQGYRRNDPGRVMGIAARALTQQEIEALAEYLSTQAAS